MEPSDHFHGAGGIVGAVAGGAGPSPGGWRLELCPQQPSGAASTAPRQTFGLGGTHRAWAPGRDHCCVGVPAGMGNVTVTTNLWSQGPGVAATKHHRPGSSKQQKFTRSCPGAWKSEGQVSVGPQSLQGLQGGVPARPPQPLGAPGVPCLWLHHPCLRLRRHKAICPVCVCTSIFSSHNDVGHWIRATLLQCDLIST